MKKIVLIIILLAALFMAAGCSDTATIERTEDTNNSLKEILIEETVIHENVIHEDVIHEIFIGG